MPSILLVLAVTLLAACAAPGAPGPLPPGTLRITGTMARFAIEGQFWAIRGDDGVVYDPVRPPAADFLVEGLRVSAVIRIRTDLAGAHMVGPIVEVMTIARL